MKIYFLGGTFDPPHIAHLNIALESLKQCQKFIFIPSKQSPHKEEKPYFEAAHRLEMLKILISGHQNIEIDKFEINSTNKISYTIHTVRYLIEKYKDASLHMIIGSDLINDIKSWKDWDEIQKRVKIICFKRVGYENISVDGIDVSFLDTVKLNVSSSCIKKTIFLNKSNNFEDFSDMISKNIYDYIYNHKLKMMQP